MADLTFDDVITFSRNSTVNGWTAGPVLTEFAIDAPAFVIDPATGKSLGYRALAGSTNKCTNHNLNPDASLTNISASAGTLDRVDDSANLPLSDQFDGNAFHLNNGTGGEVTITVTGQCGNTNAHSIGVLCRFTGTAPTVQLTGGDGSATCNNDYDETKSEDITPSASADQWQLVVPDGTEVWFVANQLEESTFISSWIETEGATGSTAADDASELFPPSCQDGFVAFWKVRTPSVVEGARLASINDDASTDRISIFSNPSGNLALFATDSSGTFINGSTDALSPDTDYVVGLRAVSGDYRLVATGLTAFTDTSANFPGGMTQIETGIDQNRGNWNETFELVEFHDDPENWSDQRIDDRVNA